MPQILRHILPMNPVKNEMFSQETMGIIMYIFSLYCGNFFTLVLHSIFMYFVYTKKIPYLQKNRISPNKPWPWEQNPQNWHILLTKTIKTLFFNTNFIGIGAMIIWSFLFQRKVILDSSQIPSIQTIVWQFFLFLLVEDLINTFTHSLLHKPSLYWIHKKHHQYTTSVSISAEYAHPIQFVFSNSVPAIIGFKFLAYFYPVHIVSAITWLIFRILLTSDLHSGYEFPWNFYKLIPFSAPASYHDFHHSHNVGNYASSFMIFEAILGNNDEYYKYQQQKQCLKGKQKSL